jgi:hypothetical protein
LQLSRALQHRSASCSPAEFTDTPQAEAAGQQVCVDGTKTSPASQSGRAAHVPDSAPHICVAESQQIEPQQV